MNIKSKSDAVKYLEEIIGEPLSIAASLQAHRRAEEMTQEQLAKKLGISRVHLSQLEKGHKFLSPDRAYAFAKKLGYAPEVFVQLSLQDQISRAGMPYIVKLKSA